MTAKIYNLLKNRLYFRYGCGTAPQQAISGIFYCYSNNDTKLKRRKPHPYCF